MKPETPPEPRFKIGDVVSLTCEDFPMTVVGKDYDPNLGHKYICSWHDVDGAIFSSYNLPEATLNPFDPT